MKRRDLFGAVLTTGIASTLVSRLVLSDDASTSPLPIVDTNITLFHWPFRRLPLDHSETLAAKLRSLGILQAWAASYEGILHRDLASANSRLVAECKRHSQWIPMGTVNPLLPGWQDDLRRCVDQYNMPGIRLYPNYHGYSLADPCFEQLLTLATETGALVQIAVSMEDTRTQHPMLQVQDVDLAPLPKLMRPRPNARVQLLNYRPTPSLLKELANSPGIFFDTARVEGTDGVAQLVHSLPPGRVLFGTHAPFLIPEAALIRVHESGLATVQQDAQAGSAKMLSEQEFRALMWETAGQVCKR